MRNFTIKEMSTMFNIPSSTLRYYESIGILNNVERTSNSQRIYEGKHIHRLNTICCFKSTGMSIANLQAFFSYEDNNEEAVDEIVELLSNQKLSVEEEILKLQTNLEHVTIKLNYYLALKNSRTLGTPAPDWKDYKTPNSAIVNEF